MPTPATPGPVGHGFTEADVTNDSVTWTASPMAGVRIIAVDANPPGHGDALLTVAERDGSLIPALDAALAARELVIVTSHYALGGLAMEGGACSPTCCSATRTWSSPSRGTPT